MTIIQFLTFTQTLLRLGTTVQCGYHSDPLCTPKNAVVLGIA